MSAIEQTISEHVVPPMTLEQHRDLLAMRLEDGYSKIEEASASGRNTARWESVWKDLLAQYESICDQIDGRH